MEQIGSFIQFDSYLNTYRIHHLVLEYLERRQDELSPEEKNAVYAQAAEWCAANDQKMDAISYYEKIGDYVHIIGLLYTLPLIIPSHIARFILEFLDRTPEAIYEQNPIIYVLRSRTLISLAMFTQAAGELKETIVKLKNLPGNPLIYRAVMSCHINLGFIGLITCPYSGDYDFVPYFEQGAYYSRLSGYVSPLPVSVVSVGSYICRVSRPEKEAFEKYISVLEMVSPYAAEAMGGCMYGLDSLARGELAFFREDLREAEKHLKAALDKARERNQYEIENRALFYLIRISLCRGDNQRIKTIFKQLKEQLGKIHYLNRFTHYDITMGWYYAHTGKPDKLTAWLKNDFEESDLHSMAHGLEILVKAKYHFAEKRYPAALAALETRKDDVAFLTLGGIETKALEAVCRYQAGDKAGAFAALKAACDLAEPNGLDMPLSELGKDMRTLVTAALKEGVPGIEQSRLEKIGRNASAYAKKFFLANDRPKGNPLSRREREILTLLSQGLTREEIADDSGLSVNTVKSTLRSIYNKLGAVNRAAAIRIAGSRGILNANQK
jgi:LuxR family maltose regulon positive regulatory protein